MLTYLTCPDTSNIGIRRSIVVHGSQITAIHNLSTGSSTQKAYTLSSGVVCFLIAEISPQRCTAFSTADLQKFLEERRAKSGDAYSPRNLSSSHIFVKTFLAALLVHAIGAVVETLRCTPSDTDPSPTNRGPDKIFPSVNTFMRSSWSSSSVRVPRKHRRLRVRNVGHELIMLRVHECSCQRSGKRLVN